MFFTSKVLSNQFAHKRVNSPSPERCPLENDFSTHSPSLPTIAGTLKFIIIISHFSKLCGEAHAA
jgi:hypothetical protein